MSNFGSVARHVATRTTNKWARFAIPPWNNTIINSTTSKTWKRIHTISPLVFTVGVLHFSTSQRHGITTKNDDGSSKDDQDDKKSNDSSSASYPTFDISQQWNTTKEFLEQIVFTDQGAKTTQASTSSPLGIMSKEDDDHDSSKQAREGWLGFLQEFRRERERDQQHPGNNNNIKAMDAKEKKESKQNLFDVQKSLMGLLMGPNQKMVEELIAKTRTSSEQGDVSDTISLEELLTILKTAADEFGIMIEKNLTGKALPTIWPTNLYYFLEFQDQIKNFSWRRRKHRFCRGINMDYVHELNSYMRIAEIGYLDDMDAIKEELSTTFGYEVIHCQMDSLPGQPSHFLAIKKDQSPWSPSLDMLLCVRGTKTITDVITDLLADAVDYRGGKAHSGICKSGRYLAEKHRATFQEFLKASGKKKIHLTLVGHSLGAGAASIAGMELHDQKEFDVQVFGFGCPALLSKDLSESSQDYITTVVADNDCIPRMSLATMMNTILDIGEYDWVPNAQQDLEDVVDQVQSALPTYITDSVKENLLQMIHSNVLSVIDIPPPTQERMDTILFPRKLIPPLVL